MPSIPYFRKVTGSHYQLVCVHCKSPITQIGRASFYKGDLMPSFDFFGQETKVYVDDTGGDVCCADIFSDAGVNGKHTPYTSFEIHPTDSHVEL